MTGSPISVRPIADVQDGIAKSSEMYHGQWLPVHVNEARLNGYRGGPEEYSRRKSTEFQEWLSGEFGDLQLAACLDSGKIMAGKINSIPKRLKSYGDVPDDWDEMLEYKNDPEGNTLLAISIVVGKPYRNLSIGRMLIEALKGIAKGRYRHMATYSTILGCPNDERLKEYYRGLHMEKKMDPVARFHISCKAQYARLIDGDMELSAGMRKRVRGGYPVTMFGYF